MIAVFALPPSAGCKIRVRTESRYGMCPLPDVKSLITRPSMKSDLLIAQPQNYFI